MTSLPEPVVIDPLSVPVLRWGIFGTGWITEEFVSSTQKYTAQQIISIASRTPGKAQTFASEWGIAQADESYESLVARDDIDAVYIATRPGDHLEHALLAISTGKHVLVEKPITTNPDDAEKIFAAAKAAGVFAMEAMWNRYLPQASVVDQLIQSGAVGQPEMLLVDFCQDQTADPRKWNPAHGTIMFDMGIYPVSFCLEYLGYPDKVEVIGKLSPEGVEQEVTSVFSYNNGARAIFTLSGLNHAPHHATISGSQGIVEFEAPFVIPSGVSFMEVGFNHPKHTWFDEFAPRGHQGLSYQATAFAKYVGAGLLESPRHPHSQSVQAVELVNTILRQLGVSYLTD